MQDRRNAAIRTLLERGLKENAAESEKLNRALVNMGMGITPEPGSPIRPAKPKAKRRRRKRAPSGQREAQFLAAVKEKPGITVAEIAKKLNVSPPNALYALANRMVKARKVVKSGARYKLKEAAPKAAPKKSAPKAAPKKAKRSTSKATKRKKG